MIIHLVKLGIYRKIYAYVPSKNDEPVRQSKIHRPPRCPDTYPIILLSCHCKLSVMIRVAAISHPRIPVYRKTALFISDV